jgi:hypothetical protein
VPLYNEDDCFGKIESTFVAVEYDAENNWLI